MISLPLMLITALSVLAPAPAAAVAPAAAPAKLVAVAAGEYVMGDDGGRYDERPAVRVALGAFAIERLEVDNGRFAAFVAASGYRPAGPWRRGFPAGGERLPVRFVTWHDADAYCRHVGRRLPSEAEWEAAAGRAADPERAVFDRVRGSASGAAGPVAVDSAGDTSLAGAMHMNGNVREWVADWYDRFAYAGYAAAGVVRDPRGPADGTPPEARFVDSDNQAGNERSTRRVVRGASFAAHHLDALRPARRDAHNPHHWFDDVGFRCAGSADGSAGASKEAP